MAWGGSKVFRQIIGELWAATSLTGFGGLDADTCKAALYDNDITPDNDVSLANSAYNVGQWASSGNEVIDATNWVAGGRAITSPVISPPGGSPVADAVFFDGADTSGAGNVTLSNAFGCLVYDDTVTAPTADPGVCYNDFGGAQSVTNGTFTIVWHANGIWRYTL